MNAVERVKSMCKERKIPISKLESDLGFGNAYVSGLKKGTFPGERLKKIADYLDVSMDYLMTGKEPGLDKYGEEVSHLYSLVRNDSEISGALLKYFDFSDEKKKYVISMITLLAGV